MDIGRDHQTIKERCEAHNLAVGPDGRCVLCRRESSSDVSRPDVPSVASSRSGLGLIGAIGAGCLGVAFLGGVALAKGHRTAPLTEARPPVLVEPVAALPLEVPPLEVPPRLQEPQPEALEVNPAPPPPRPPVVPSPEPQRNYLDEAYAALDKRGLYDTAQAPKAAVATAAKTPCVPRTYMMGQRYPYGAGYGYGYTRSGSGVSYGSSAPSAPIASNSGRFTSR